MNLEKKIIIIQKNFKKKQFKKIIIKIIITTIINK